MNQPVFEQSPHPISFTTWDSHSEERVNQHFSYFNKQRIMPYTTTDMYREILLTPFEKQPSLEHSNHAAKQSYIVLGLVLIAEANEQVDSTSMEGYFPKALDELLKFKKKGTKSTGTLVLGFRDSELDWLVNPKKSREPLNEFATIIN